MSNNLVKRYARAFFDIAAEEKGYERYDGELSRIAIFLQKNQEADAFLKNPVVDLADKRAIMEEILKAVPVSAMTANFIKLLVDKKRIDLLRDIASCYRDLMDDALRKVRVQVVSAFPLADDLRAALRKKLEVQTGQNVEMTLSQDTSLLGGIVVRMGDTLYDGSVKAQLDNIRNLVEEET